MKRFLATVLACLLVCLPCKLQAQDVTDFEFVEKVEWTQCGDKACMTFEEAKKLAALRAQYVTLFRMVPILQVQVDTWEKSSEDNKAAFQMMRTAHDRLDQVIDIKDEQLKETIKAKNKAERFSIFGPAGTVAVVFATLTFAVGVWVGSR